MTSKISFSRLRMEDLKHRLSMIIISFFLFFMNDILYYLTLQGHILSDEAQQVKDFVRIFASGAYWQNFIIIPLAALLGINAFHFLHNRSRVDFQMALPISRTKLYGIIVSNGFLIFLVPYLLSVLAQTVITTALGAMCNGYMTWIIKGMLCGVAAFLIIYLLMAVCMLLTGQIYVAIMAFLVFNSYTFVVWNMVLESLSGIFFHTYRSMNLGLSTFLQMLSPGLICINLVENYTTICLLAAVLWILVLALASYFLFQVRPAESAGIAMAFSRGKLLIKGMITVPMAVIVGIFLSSVAGLENGILLYLGSILGGIIFHGIIECIYQNDIRALWSHRKHLLGVLLLTMALLLVFDVDLFGYDSYCPKAEQLNGIKIEESGATFTEYFGEEKEEEIHLSTETCEKIMEKMEEIIAMNKENVMNPDENENYQYMTVRYYKKNGKRTNRSYKVKREQYDDLARLLYDSEDYRHTFFHIYTEDAKKIKSVMIHHPEMNGSPVLTESEIQELVSILKEEYDQITYEDVKKEYPVSAIEIAYSFDNTNNRDAFENYGVYPSFTKTIAFLEKHDCKMGANAANLSLVNLQISYPGESDIYNEKTVTDQKLIESVKDKLYYQELRSNMNSIDASEGDIYGIDTNNATYAFYTDEETRDILINAGE